MTVQPSSITRTAIVRIEGIGKRFGGPKRSPTLGWDVVYVAIDDHSRLSNAEQLPDEHGQTAAALVERALRFFAAHRIPVIRVTTDKGSPYVSRAFAAASPSGGSGTCGPGITRCGRTARPRRR